MLDFKINSILIDQLIKGNHKAFTFLVDKYNQRLCTYANRIANDPERAQDIVQNVFIKTWEKRESLKNELSLKGFLYRAVYNECIDQYRCTKSTMILERFYLEAIIEMEVETKSEDLEEIMEKVMETVNDLPPKCKEIFLLSKKEGLTNLEIAEYLSISTKTVENQMTKAYNWIREKLNFQRKKH